LGANRPGLPAEIIARYIIAHPYKDIQVTVIETTKRLILRCADALATTIGESPSAWSRKLVMQVLEWGGRAESTILPSGRRIPAPQVAWIHGTMMYSLDCDGVHEGTIIHALTAHFPAALAAAEAKGHLSGREFISGVSLFVDLILSH
jgi:2-methylcitrate dehydratase PrpD